MNGNLIIDLPSNYSDELNQNVSVYYLNLTDFLDNIEEIILTSNFYVLGAVIHFNIFESKNIPSQIYNKITQMPWPTVISTFHSLGDSTVELFLTKSNPQYNQYDTVHYAYTDQVMFTAIQWNDQDLVSDTQQAYTQLIEHAQKFAKPLIYRMWNEIPFINRNSENLELRALKTSTLAQDYSPHEERYKLFCSGRTQAFNRHHWPNSRLPAASALGGFGHICNVYMLSGCQPSRIIENSRQMSAFKYPIQYGKDAPLFARAHTHEINTSHRLYVSGTASILGHQSIYIEQVHEQTIQSLENIEWILNTANQTRVDKFSFTPTGAHIKVYCRNIKDLDNIKHAVQQFFEDRSITLSTNVLYVHGDICREELLVEIEAQFATEASRPLTPKSVFN